MQICWNKDIFLHYKSVNPQRMFICTPTWPPFSLFCTPIWPPWRQVKTIYLCLSHFIHHTRFSLPKSRPLANFNHGRHIWQIRRFHRWWHSRSDNSHISRPSEKFRFFSEVEPSNDIIDRFIRYNVYLWLFLNVLFCVHSYLHAKSIIHRDLKTNSILEQSQVSL